MAETAAPTTAAPTTAAGVRARVRAEMTTAIADEARRQLAAEGATGLSLRAVARALGMASSGIYRYVASRDELLTLLIVDAYDALGARAEAADAACARHDHLGRWCTVGRTVREWALAAPHEYALVYGSPVPGYRAPEDTVGPASRVTLVLARILVDAHAAGALAPTDPADAPPAAVTAGLGPVRALAFPDVDPAVVVRAMGAWMQLFGMVSFELFGHLHNVVDDPGVLFGYQLELLGRSLGVATPAA